MKRNTRKGFTGIELVIVIAIIAILASALIPTFGGLFQGANKTADTQLIQNLNAALLSDTDGVATVSEALALAEEYGFDVAKINAKALNNEILWDSERNVFCYFNDGEIEYMNEEHERLENDLDYWVISGDKEDLSGPYSVYYVGNDEPVVTYTGFDAGKSGVTQVTYIDNTTNGKNVTIRTTGGTLIVNALMGTVNHEGTAETVLIHAVHTASYHEFGEVNYIEIGYGHIEIEEGAKVNTVVANEATDAVKDKLAELEKNPEVIITNESGNDVKGFAVEGVNIGGNSMVGMTDIAVNEVYAIKQGATKFAGGTGTENDPYLIANAEQFKNIGSLYETGYYYFAVQAGVESIDLSNIGRINLNGSFDGNNVVFRNVDGYVFNVVGSGDSSADNAVTLQNFEVQFVGGFGVARCCGATTLNFVNIAVTGYSLQDWNAGLFLRYGTANVTSGGFNYTVNFSNCSSNAEIYATANPWSTILVGHTYQGAGHTTTIKVDKFTDENINGTKVYYTGTNKTPEGKKYYGAKSDTVTVYVDGKETTANTALNIVPVVATKHPAKTEAGDYAIKTEADTTKVVISLTWQYTLWTENYESKIDNQSGVGGLIGDNVVLEVTGNSDVSVFGQITEIEIVTGADKWDYELKDGKLILYMTTDNSYVDGWVTLNIEQYASGSNIAKYKGSMRLALKDKAADWVIY